jgi:cytochrome P450
MFRSKWYINNFYVINGLNQLSFCQAAGKAIPSLTSSLIERHKHTRKQLSKEEEDIIKWSGASFYAAGADTSTATLDAFFIAMALFPDVLKRAQAEVDSVLGDQRLPRCTDKVNLPYVSALVKEVLRWHAVFSTSEPYRTMVFS